MRKLLLGMASTLIVMGTPLQAAKPPATWDGLVQVKASKLDVVYLAPNADFRPYTKVMIETPQVAFRKNWQRDYNSSRMGLMGRATEADIRREVDGASQRFHEKLTEAFTRSGYEVVSQPGPDVLRVVTAVLNVQVVAPDMMTAGRSRTYSEEAGEATLAVEARDSGTGALLGRAVDRRIAGENGQLRRDRVSNRSDFDRLFNVWARLSADGLGKLKAQSPIGANAQAGK